MRQHIARLVSFLILAGIIAGCNSEKNAVEKTLRSYFKAYYSERTVRAYDYLTIEDRKALPMSEYFAEWSLGAPCFAPRHTMDAKIAKYIKENEHMQQRLAREEKIYNSWLGKYFTQKISEITIDGNAAKANVQLTVPIVPESAMAFVRSVSDDEKISPQEIAKQLRAEYREVIRSTTVVADCLLVAEEGRWAIYKGFAKHKDEK